MDSKKKKNKFGPRRRKLAGKNSHERSLDKSIFSRSLRGKNGSFLQNATLKANNRALARALADMRTQFGLAHQQNLTYQFEQQSFIQRINELEHLVSLQPKDVEKKLSENYKRKFFYIQDGLNDVCQKLLDVVDILPNLIEVCKEVTSGKTAETPEESTLNQSTSYNNISLPSQQSGELKDITNLSYDVKSYNSGPLKETPKIQVEPVQRTAFDMSVIMEHSGLEETLLQALSETVEVRGSIPTKHKRSSIRRWSGLFKISSGDKLADSGNSVVCESRLPETSSILNLEDLSEEPTVKEISETPIEINQISKISVVSPSNVLSTNHTSNCSNSSSDDTGPRKLRRTTFLVKESKQILPYPFDLDRFSKDENVLPNSEQFPLVCSVDPLFVETCNDRIVCENGENNLEENSEKTKNSNDLNHKKRKTISTVVLKSRENDPDKVLSLPSSLNKENKARRKKKGKSDVTEIFRNELQKPASDETEQFPIENSKDSSVKDTCENNKKVSRRKKSPKKRQKKNLDQTHQKLVDSNVLKSSDKDQDMVAPLLATTNKENKARKKKVKNEKSEMSKNELPKYSSLKSEEYPVITGVDPSSGEICNDINVCENNEKESCTVIQKKKKTKNSTDLNHKKGKKITIEKLQSCENDPDQVPILAAEPNKGNRTRKKKIKEVCN